MNTYELAVADPEGRAASAAHYLESTFRGPVHLPGDDDYDAQRATFAGTLDSRPAVVAEATSPADVRAAVLTAREYGLPLAVQATGHGTFVPSDGGLLVKTGQMAQVLVDPDRRIARVGPGARWSEVIAAAAPFGLAPLSGSSPSVGVTGYTLGGGVGWLSRKHGYAADSLVRADVVTADGRLLTATRDRNADLFWALRGGGGNFGVVTGLEFRLYPVSEVFGGIALFPIGRAGEVLARFRDWAPAQPDELTASVVLFRESPDPRVPGPVLGIRGFFAGEAARAVRALRPLVQAAGSPLADRFRPMDYAGTKAIGGIPSRRFELFERLPDAVIGAVIDAVTRDETAANAVEVRHWGGAIARPDADAGPVGHRDVPFSISIDGPPELGAPLASHATGGSFLNFLKDATRTHTAYTAADYARLRVLKGAYDPDNVFSRGHVIAPCVTAAVEADCA